MTSKEKAKELYNKFLDPQLIVIKTEKRNSAKAKKNALICCDEVLGHMGADRGYSFWMEVREEIEKL